MKRLTGKLALKYLFRLIATGSLTALIAACYGPPVYYQDGRYTPPTDARQTAPDSVKTVEPGSVTD
ncbi:MAG: hypothetical protein NT080_13450 [Spirochaetes bacterium]|nr:hypothetical protein [Spirochaetota bacterium]